MLPLLGLLPGSLLAALLLGFPQRVLLGLVLLGLPLLLSDLLRSLSLRIGPPARFQLSLLCLALRLDLLLAGLLLGSLSLLLSLLLLLRSLLLLLAPLRRLLGPRRRLALLVRGPSLRVLLLPGPLLLLLLLVRGPPLRVLLLLLGGALLLVSLLLRPPLLVLLSSLRFFLGSPLFLRPASFFVASGGEQRRGGTGDHEEKQNEPREEGSLHRLLI